MLRLSLNWTTGVMAGCLCVAAACAPGSTAAVEVPPDTPQVAVGPARSVGAKRDPASNAEAPALDPQAVRRNKPQASPRSLKPKREPFKAGRGTFRLGGRPPWASLDSEKLQSAAPNPRGKRWRLKRTFWVGEGYLYQAAFTPDQQSVVSLSNRSGRLYRYALSGKLLQKTQLPDFREFADASFIPLANNADRPQLLLARPGGSSVVDLETQSFEPREQTPAGSDVRHTRRPGLYGVSSRKTAPQSGDLTLQWQSGALALHVDCNERPDDWALSPDGLLLALSYYPSDVVEVIALEAETLLGQIELPKYGGSIDISPDGKRIALGGAKLVVASFPSGEILAEDTQYSNNIHNVRFTADGGMLLTSAYDGKARSYILPADLEQTKKLPRAQYLPHSGGANVYGIGLSKDGSKLITSSGDQTLKLWVR